jgi:hypothetical protein
MGAVRISGQPFCARNKSKADYIQSADVQGMRL